MNRLKEISRTPQFLVAQIFLEVVVGLALIGLFVWVYTQSETQHQICQAFQFIGDRTQQQITLTATRLQHDKAVGDSAAVSLDRKSILDATSFLIRVQRVQC